MGQVILLNLTSNDVFWRRMWSIYSDHLIISDREFRQSTAVRIYITYLAPWAYNISIECHKVPSRLQQSIYILVADQLNTSIWIIKLENAIMCYRYPRKGKCKMVTSRCTKSIELLFSSITYMCASLQISISRAFIETKMMSSNGNIFRVTGPLSGEFTGQRWIPLKKASHAELWCFL